MKGVSAVIEQEIPNSLFNAANLAAANMQRRVFNHGKTVQGITLRYRSEQYKRKRIKKGRQVAYKDFIFEGNLFNSLQYLNQGGRSISYGFGSNTTSDIANYVSEQEDLVRPDIFGLSADEVNKSKEVFNNGVIAAVKRYLGQ